MIPNGNAFSIFYFWKFFFFFLKLFFFFDVISLPFCFSWKFCFFSSNTKNHWISIDWFHWNEWFFLQFDAQNTIIFSVLIEFFLGCNFFCNFFFFFFWKLKWILEIEIIVWNSMKSNKAHSFQIFHSMFDCTSFDFGNFYLHFDNQWELIESNHETDRFTFNINPYNIFYLFFSISIPTLFSFTFFFLIIFFSSFFIPLCFFCFFQ